MKWFFLSLMVIFLCLSLGLVDASATTLSGLDLYNNPSVSFPNGNPTISGTSIIFGPIPDPGGSVPQLLKLFVLPLYSAGELSGLSSASFMVSANLTRLPCIGGSCAGDEIDWDPHIMVTDGTDMVGAFISNDLGGGGGGSHQYDAGDKGADRVNTRLFSNTGFPDINQSIDIKMLFTLTNGSTQVDVSLLGYTGSYTTTMALNKNSALSLVLVRDNDVGEQYQINSVTFPTSVPEPSTLLLLGAGLAGVGIVVLLKRRQKTK